MNLFAVLVWIVVLVLMLILEAATAGLVSIWFAGGALSAMVAALCGGSAGLQVVLFVAVSGLLLAGLRPLTKKLREGRGPVPTNADRILRQTAVVTEEIDNLRETGAVRADGKTWTARRAGGGDPIAPGALVRILRIEGVKALVEPADKRKEEKV